MIKDRIKLLHRIAVLQDTSMDMETIKDVPFSGSGQENGSYYFVKKPNLPDNISITEHQEPYFQESIPAGIQDVSLIDDEEFEEMLKKDYKDK
jgi:hypothetical protein